MPASHDVPLERITSNPDGRFGKPCIRGHRITVQEILEWLSSGASQQQILDDYQHGAARFSGSLRLCR